MAFDHLWNDLPDEERFRLHPYQVESHILHLRQTREMIVAAHKALLERLDAQISNLERALPDGRPTTHKGECR